MSDVYNIKYIKEIRKEICKMHKIKLVPDSPYPYKCDVTVYDVTSGEEKKRCRIDVDYSEDDIEDLKKQGMDKAAVMKYIEKDLYDTVRMYILDEWECTEGKNEIMKIVDEHIRDYF